jgi:hypothetical protein
MEQRLLDQRNRHLDRPICAGEILERNMHMHLSRPRAAGEMNMIRKMISGIAASALACGLGLGILGCQSDNSNPSDTTNGNYPSSSHPSNNGTGWNSNDTSTGNGAYQSSPNRETSGGTINNAGSMSKEQPSTQP